MLAKLVIAGLLTAGAVGSLASTSTSTSTVAAPAVHPAQETATLLARHAARKAPRRGAARLRMVSAQRPITRARTVLPVTGHARDAAGRLWLRVRLPGRPNSGVGWIERAGTRAGTTNVRLVLDISRRKVTAYVRGRPVRSFAAIVGARSTPTPIGEFFVEEAIALPSTAVGAPYALALSARSNVFQAFEGGPGQVAFHGLGNVGGRLGTAVSHGCVRLDARAMGWLVDHVGPGVPVSIHG